MTERSTIRCPSLWQRSPLSWFAGNSGAPGVCARNVSSSACLAASVASRQLHSLGWPMSLKLLGGAAATDGSAARAKRAANIHDCTTSYSTTKIGIPSL